MTRKKKLKKPIGLKSQVHAAQRAIAKYPKWMKAVSYWVGSNEKGAIHGDY